MKAVPVAVLCAVAVLTLPLAAQDQGSSPVIGVGISVPDVGVRVPINIGRRVRVEPYVDFSSSRADYPVTSDTSWFTYTRIGLGLFAVSHRRERVGLYFGPRFGFLHGSTRINGAGGATATKSSGWFLAGAIGAEYTLVAAFSVAGEAKIEYDHTTSSSSGSASIGPSLYARSWYSAGGIVVRFYP